MRLQPRPFHTVLLAVLLIVATALPGLAQTDQTGVLAGSVVSEDGAVVAGAVVLGVLTEGGAPHHAVTDEDGVFRLAFLAPGSYSVTVQAGGFRDQRIEDLRISATQTRRIEIEMAIAEEFSEVLTVVAGSELIDTSAPTLESTLSAEEVDLLPISRVATDLVKFTPGASNQSVWGGSTDQANSYRLDGVSVNQPGFGGDFLLPNVDWIEEIQVKGLGAGAQHGNFQGGLINIVTKSGSNASRGGLRLNFENDDLAASNRSDDDVTTELDARWEASVDASGPIVRDRLFYFVSAQHSEDDTKVVDGAAPGTFLDTREERTENKLFGKIDWAASDRDRVHVQLGWDDVETENRGLDGFTAPEAAETQDSPALFGSLSWSRTLGSNLFLETKATGYDADEDRLPRDRNLPAVQLLDGNRDLFTNAVHTRLRSPRSLALAASLDAYFTTGPLRHDLKFGGETEDGSWREQRIRNAGFTWRPETGSGAFDPQDPDTWGFISSDWGADINLDADTENTALYVQDDIAIGSRVTLSAGLRWGRWKGELTPGFGGGDAFTAVEDDAFDPRLGAVVDLLGDGRLIGKAHWGRYHQNLFALLFDRVEGGDVFQDLEFWDWAGPGNPDPNRAYSLAERDEFFELFRIRSIAGESGPALDYSQPYVDQLVVSLEQQIGERWKAGLTWVRRENEDIVALADLNRETNYTLFENISVFDFRSGDPILDADGDPLVLPRVFVSNDDILFVGGAPGLTDDQVDALTWDPELVLTNVDDAERTMDQIQLVVERIGPGWSFEGSLVHTDLEGNFFSVSGYADPGGIGAGSFVDVNESLFSQGRLSGVDEWEAKVRFTGTLPWWGLRAGLYGLYGSGEAVTPVYEIDDRNHDFVTADGEFLDPDLLFGIGGQDVFVEPRGSRELGSFTLVDLHLDKVFSLSGNDLVVGFDLFNVFNEDAVTSIRTLVNDQDPSDAATLFGSPRRRVEPRTARLYASFRW